MNSARCCAITLALLLPGLGHGADLQPSKSSVPDVPASQQSGASEELTEVIVLGGKPITRRADLREWLTRLVGQFSYEGYVEVPRQGRTPDHYPVRGVADCVGFGPVPGVLCQLNVHWPDVRGDDGKPIVGGASNLSPAMVLYGMDARSMGVRYLQVDSQGTAARTLGELHGDTLLSRDACVNSPVNCVRITRITAEEGSNVIAYVSDHELDNKRVIRYAFLLHRVSNAQKARQLEAAPK